MLKPIKHVRRLAIPIAGVMSISIPNLTRTKCAPSPIADIKAAKFPNKWPESRRPANTNPTARKQISIVIQVRSGTRSFKKITDNIAANKGAVAIITRVFATVVV